jgi:RNA polymerase sigma factor (sigma-70 family)
MAALQEQPNSEPPPSSVGPPGQTLPGAENSGVITRHIDRIREQKDPEAMKLIMERYLEDLIRYIARRCDATALPGEGPEDLAQETLNSFWKRASAGRFPKLKDRNGLRKLLCTIAKRKVAHRVRDAGRLKRGGDGVLNATDADAWVSEDRDNVLDTLASREPLPEVHAIADETVAAARAAIGNQKLLPVFDLWMADLTQSEIAGIMKVSVTTVGRRMAEIWGRLRDLADEAESDDL